ncbi:MAG TPA: STAS domain-containing protein [Amycolatopsis sp.]|uniref:STAS domain-containing protein n=1 Tax=Amycolatopsis sp. TaxID=37632 RepID=UPI002B4754F6|nr:STAS domain-containing protein [Amycolatopsis sp.]HKS45672.1 STAS domain-containing protein [Amycolatopsis sp.]
MRQTERAGCLVLRLTGRLDSVSYLEVRDLLVKLALEQPRAVVVDIDELEVAAEHALTVFSAARAKVSDWPEVPIVVLAADGARHAWLTRCAFSRFVPVFATVDEAVRSVRTLAPRRRATADFPPAAGSSAPARRFARRVCAEWRVGLPIEEILCVVSELVENVLKHAGTPLQLKLELRNGLLTVAVRDGSPRQAMLCQGPSGTPVGYGLRLVAEFARAWGCSPDLRGGKVVWAVLTAGPEWFRKFPPWRPRQKVL